MQLQALTPILWIKNLQETITYYETILGFEGPQQLSKFCDALQR